MPLRHNRDEASAPVPVPAPVPALARCEAEGGMATAAEGPGGDMRRRP